MGLIGMINQQKCGHTWHANRNCSYLENQSSLCSETMLQEEGALVACHAVKKHSQHAA